MGCREPARSVLEVNTATMGRSRKENMMAKYLLLKHYRGGPAPAVDFPPMDQRPPVTDGPFVETKDLIAGWYIIDVESWGPRGTAGGGAVGGPRARRQADLRMAGGSGRFWPTRPRSPSERAAAAGPRTRGDRPSVKGTPTGPPMLRHCGDHGQDQRSLT